MSLSGTTNVENDHILVQLHYNFCDDPQQEVLTRLSDFSESDK